MGNKITVTTEKDGRTVIFEGSGTLTTTERVGKWVDTRPTSTSRDVHGVEIEWDGIYTIREADHQHDTLGELRAAWEAAEEADECRKGDVLIERFGPDAYHAYLAEGNHLHLPRAIRVLSRAPREPWQDLADAFKTWDYPVRGYEEELAKWVYAKGVRVTGGEDGDE